MVPRTYSVLRLVLPLSLATAACGVDSTPSPDIVVEDEFTRLQAELAKLPGELVMTTSADMPFSDELKARLATADKILHVYSDGTAVAFTGEVQQALPEGVADYRVFQQLGGDIVIANQELLPAYLAQHDPRKTSDGISEATGLPIGTGGLWPDATVAYVIDPSISDAWELAQVRQAISTWNTSLDPNGKPMKVRFVPRYWADNRPYVQFVRGGSRGCASSAVGRHDTVFTNAFSHNIAINPGCFTQRTIQHEMGHTAGLYHEQQRCDRDNFVNVMAPWGVDCERYCGGNSVSYGPYNYLSIMHYGYGTDPDACSIQQITPSSTNFRGSPSQAGSTTSLDSFDVQGINEMYQGAATMPLLGPGRFYNLIPQYTNKVLAVPASSMADDVQLVLWDKIPGLADQQFSIQNDVEGYVTVHPRHSGKSLEVGGFSTANGGPVKQWTYFGGVNQKWIIAPSVGAPGLFDIINKNSGKSIDIPGWSTTNGTLIQQWDHTNGTNQRFSLAPAN